MKFFEIEGDEGIRKLLSFVSNDYDTIHLYATDDSEFSVEVYNIMMSDGLFLQVPLECGTDDSESESDSEPAESLAEYDDKEMEELISRKKRDVKDGLEDYKRLSLEMTFKDIEEGREYCKLYALASKKQLVNIKSDKSRVRYECADPDCPFAVLISKEDGRSHGARVKTLIEHIDCDTAFDNNVVDQSTIALYFKEKIQSDPKYKIKDMREDLNRVFNLNVSFAKCKRAKREILDTLQGSFVDNYKKLEAYANELRKTNPGSDIVINLSKDAFAEGRRKFLRMYICFNALKMGFKGGLRPLIGLDGTFLKGKTKGQLLVAVGLDNANHFYPLAWAVVGKENKRTWTWFMQHLEQSLDLKLGEGITIMSDMQKGLLESVRSVLPEAHQRFCVRHIEANWCKRWGKGELKKLLWWSAWSSYSEEFDDHLKEIKELDEEAGVALISSYPPKTWCRAFFDTICKNQTVDNNFVESFNGWILEARRKPIIGMLEDIRVKVMNRMDEIERTSLKWKEDFSPMSIKLYNEYKKIAQVCVVNGNGDMGFEVTEGTDRHIVNLRDKKCTCRSWGLCGIPCPHAIKAMLHKKMNPKKEIHWFHGKEAFLLTYKNKLQPVGGEQMWKIEPEMAMEPPELVKLVGRPKKNREREKDEALKRQGVWKTSRKGKVMTCSTCGEPNHNMRSCKKGKVGGEASKTKATKAKKPTATKKNISKKRAAGQQDEQQPGRGKKSASGQQRGIHSRLINEEEPCEEEINLTAPQATQSSQETPSSSRFREFMDDEEDPRLHPKVVSEEDFITRLLTRKQAQQPTGTRRIVFRGGRDGVSEPSNSPIVPRGLMWNGGAAITSNQIETALEKLRPKKD